MPPSASVPRPTPVMGMAKAARAVRSTAVRHVADGRHRPQAHRCPRSEGSVDRRLAAVTHQGANRRHPWTCLVAADLRDVGRLPSAIDVIGIAPDRTRTEHRGGADDGRPVAHLDRDRYPRTAAGLRGKRPFTFEEAGKPRHRRCPRPSRKVGRNDAAQGPADLGAAYGTHQRREFDHQRYRRPSPHHRDVRGSMLRTSRSDGRDGAPQKTSCAIDDIVVAHLKPDGWTARGRGDRP
jgi:hypothetical protein